MIYSAILGSIIYSFITNLVSFVIHRDTVNFLQDLGVGRNIGFTFFTIFSFLVIWHYCTDFLYTMYSESIYTVFNFICDVFINFFLALSFILLSESVTKTVNSPIYIKYSLGVFWGSLIIIYLIFFVWDYTAYKGLRTINVTQATFYKSMVFPFEISGIIVYLGLLVGCFVFIDRNNWGRFLYLIVSLVAFFIYTLWFWLKLKELERLTRT